MPSSTSSFKTDHLPQPSKAAKKRKAGRRKFQETRHPVYKGVRQRNGKWVCELRPPKKKTTAWVGTFASSKMAAVAYDVVALALKGESAALNFPELAHSFPRFTSSSSISDIRTRAVEVAEAFSSEEKVVPEVFLERLVVDEEELFNMPAIIAGMAEGLILTPPGMKRGFGWEEYETTAELSLWSDE